MRWPPYEHVIFDCDSTLTAVEGIDILAESLGKGWRVSVLTQAAMDGEIELNDVYEKRLRTLKPTRGQIWALRHVYKRNVVPDAREVISLLQTQGHSIYIVSGGLHEPVAEFGVYLGVPRENIQAVGIDFDSLSGNWWQQLEENENVDQRYSGQSEQLLTLSAGKAQIIEGLLANKSGRSLLIGDGVSDLLASSAVDLFVGYGGVTSRPRVAQEAEIFITSKSLAPLVAIAAGPALLHLNANAIESEMLKTASRLIHEGAIKFKDEQVEKKFQAAYEGPYKAIHPRPFGS